MIRIGLGQDIGVVQAIERVIALRGDVIERIGDGLLVAGIVIGIARRLGFVAAVGGFNASQRIDAPVDDLDQHIAGIEGLFLDPIA
jgi:hypothetical protein